MKEIVTPLSEHGWAEQLVFADGAGRLVGFENDQQCCEDYRAYWWSVNDSFHYESARFADPFVEVDPPDAAIDSEWDEPAVVAFRIIDANGVEGYLIIGNSHNGYYTHEYVVKDGESVIASGGV